jgi:predicted enzyme involved in methoxymalonyl-ACP biosynthesis
VEQAMLALALEEARRRGCGELSGQYIPTAKNDLAAGVYSRFGFTDAGEGWYRLAVTEARIAIPPYLRLALSA